MLARTRSFQDRFASSKKANEFHCYPMESARAPARGASAAGHLTSQLARSSWLLCLAGHRLSCSTCSALCVPLASATMSAWPRTCLRQLTRWPSSRSRAQGPGLCPGRAETACARARADTLGQLACVMGLARGAAASSFRPHLLASQRTPESQTRCP